MTKAKDEKAKPVTALTREAILGSDDLKTEAVEVEDWGGTVYVHTLTGNERDAWEERCTNQKKNRINIRLLKAKLVIASCFDAAGKKLFVETDAEVLNDKSAKCIDQLFAVAQRLSGLSTKEAEEIAGN